MNKKIFLGFTLAEVLVTLTILGVLATIVIPNVVKQYQRRITVTKVKKYYAKLTEAYEIHKIKNTETKLPNSSKEIFENFIKPYFKISYDAGNNGTKQRSILPQNTPYYYLNNEIWTNLPYGDWYTVKLYDGSIFIIRYYPQGIIKGYGNCGSIYIDLNGAKGPNKFGEDLFLYTLTTYANDFYSIGGYNPHYQASAEENKSHKKSVKEMAETCNKTQRGQQCVAWILAKNNMKYLDCPNGIDFDTEKCK